MEALPDEFAWSGTYILESLDPPSEYHSAVDEQDDCPRETRGAQAILDDLPVFPGSNVTEPTTTTTLPPTTSTITAPPCPFHGGEPPPCLMTPSEASSFIEFVGIETFEALGYEYNRDRDLATSFCDFPEGLIGQDFRCEFQLPSGRYGEAIARFSPSGDITVVEIEPLEIDRD